MLILMSVILAASASVSMALPVHRAASVDPMVVLRDE
jgi:hypothetical protein